MTIRQGSFYYLLLGALMVASVLFVIGLTAPLMTIKTLLFLRNSFSVLSGIQDLWVEGKYFLFFVICIFSIALPSFKIIFLAAFLFRGNRANSIDHKILSVIHDLGRWAMLDVMIVAILLVTVKLGAIASVEVHWGLYVFGAAVLMIMLLTDRIVKLNKPR